MTSPSEPAAKLPLIKRVVLAMRNIKSGGGSPILLIVLLIICIAGSLFGFISGLRVGTHHAQVNQQKLIADIRAAKTEIHQINDEKADLRKQLDEATEKLTLQTSDYEQLKEQLAQAKTERDAMEKILNEFRESLLANNSSNQTGKADKPASGATLKFGNNECPLDKDGVSSKHDVKCLNLREAIDAMNAASAAKSTKPASSPPGK